MILNVDFALKFRNYSHIIKPFYMSQMNPKKFSTILYSQFNSYTLPVTSFNTYKQLHVKISFLIFINDLLMLYLLLPFILAIGEVWKSGLLYLTFYTLIIRISKSFAHNLLLLRLYVTV